MTESNSSSGGGIGLFGVLGVVFVVLKLTHVIDWSWWYVTVPFWGGLALVLVIVGVPLILVGIAAVVVIVRDHLRRRARRQP